MKARCPIQPFNMASRCQTQIRESRNRLLFSYDDLRCAESSLRNVGIVGYVSLDDLCKINVRTEIRLYGVNVGSQSIARDLHAITHARRNVRYKGVRGR